MTYILVDILSTLFPTVLVGVFLKTSDLCRIRPPIDLAFQEIISGKKESWMVHPPIKRLERHSELHLCVSATNT